VHLEESRFAGRNGSMYGIPGQRGGADGVRMGAVWYPDKNPGLYSIPAQREALCP